jgi:hypothetical protein
MNCVILQPSYIPWRGYFHQISKADCFVFYDDVQYDKNGWRNRNRIKTGNGPVWLTIPVLHRGSVNERTPIMDIRIDWSKDWSRKHWLSIQQSYSKAPYFDQYANLLEGFYRQRPEFLADFTIDLTIAITRILGIEKTRFIRSSELGGSGVKTDRLVDLLGKLGATHYISGPSASDYLEEDKLANAGISLEFIAYDFPEYAQLYPPFDAQVSILDLLFMTGPQAGSFIWGAKQ